MAAKGGGAVVALASGGASRPPHLDRLRVRGLGGVSAGAGDSRALCTSPHLLFYGVV